MLYFVLKLSPSCMSQITNLQGGTPIALNSDGVIDGIKSVVDSEKISFTLHSSLKYNLDIDSPLVIVPDNGRRPSTNIAVPICIDFDTNKSLVGKVIDTNNNPVAGAKVTTNIGSSLFAIFTNSQGELSNTQSIEIQDGEATFIVTKEGYSPTEKSTISTTLKAGSKNEIGEMVLEPEKIEVTGTIRTELGKPISDTNVTILELDSNQTTSIITGENGTYSYPTEIGKKIAIQVYSELYGSDRIAPTTVTKSLHNFDFTLKDRIIEVNITSSVIEESNGKPVANAIVKILDSSKTTLAVTRTDENGKFSIKLQKLASETMKLRLKVSAKEHQTIFVPIDEVAPNSLELDPIKLSYAPSQLVVEVVDNKFKIVKDASINLYRDGEEEPAFEAKTDKNGTAILEDVDKGHYLMVVSHAGYSSVMMPITLKGKDKYFYINMLKLVDAKGDDILYYSQGILESDDSLPAQFDVLTSYSKSDNIWKYSISLSKENNDSNISLDEVILDLDDKCLSNLADATDGYVIGADADAEVDNGLKWETTGGTFSFKIDGEFKASKTFFVPLILKSGTEMTTVNIPGPICQ